MEYKLAIFIGRFQPVHNSHIEVIRQGLKVAEKVLVIIGSAYSAPNIKNPFSATQRTHFIKDALTYAESNRVVFDYVRDYFYNENIWISDVQQCAKKHYFEGDSVTLIGSYKDSSSYYLKLFPQFDFIAAKNTKQLNSTDIRKELFNSNNIDIKEGWTDFPKNKYSFKDLSLDMPANVRAYLFSEFCGSDKHISLLKEYQFIEDYKAKWESSPFPPTFVTTDCVIIQSGHILLVKRKFEPGKGLLALPGGFIKQGETIESAAIRELKEETGIRVHKEILRSNIKDSKVFDHPDRSLRGRTITHAYFIKLDGGELPEVKGNDDAEGAMWYPIMDLGRLEPQFYEDHAHIINYFLNRG